jgi:hypothetical protein
MARPGAAIQASCRASARSSDASIARDHSSSPWSVSDGVGTGSSTNVPVHHALTASQSATSSRIPATVSTSRRYLT